MLYDTAFSPKAEQIISFVSAAYFSNWNTKRRLQMLFFERYHVY